MAETAVIFRWSPQSFVLDEKMRAHIASCPICRSAARAGVKEEPFHSAAKGGCIAFGPLFEQWVAEYLRLHSPAERAAHDALAEKHGVDCVSKALSVAAKVPRG